MAVLWLAACASTGSGHGPPPELEDWAAGPVRWYLLSSERRAIQEVGSSTEAVNFIEQFWHLRDPDPETPENSFRELFASRVEAADLLYAEGSIRGSLTPRGRALVLLGPPVHLQVATEPVLSWSAKKNRQERVITREVDVEVWRYPPEDLPERFEAVLRARGIVDGAELRFQVEPAGTRLVEGEELLQLAAAMAVVAE
ncbi:MAG: GWxTD domain-containing protein [Thermoanaerobaculia bacterium]